MHSEQSRAFEETDKDKFEQEAAGSSHWTGNSSSSEKLDHRLVGSFLERGHTLAFVERLNWQSVESSNNVQTKSLMGRKRN